MSETGLRRSTIGLLVALIVTTPASAQTVERSEKPPTGEEVTASAGSPVWEQHEYTGVPGVITGADVDARWGNLEHVELPSESALIIRRERRLKACQSKTTFQNLPFQPSMWSNCLIDDDNDGRFDKVSYSDGGMTKRLTPPVPYARSVVEVAGGGAPSFRKLLIFTGADAGTIRFSYREFSNGMARPAFTEDLTVPLEAEFPQEVVVKGSTFRVLRLDGRGLTFVRLE